MKKILLLTAILFVVSLTLPTVAAADTQAGNSANLLTLQSTGSSESDLRVVALQNVLEKHNSPLVSEAPSFVKYADQNGVDWKLLPSISGVESTYGQALLKGTYNAYGWGNGLIAFKDWDDGIETIDKSLKQDYIDKLGTDNVYSIGSIYAASKTWASRVSTNMDEFETEYVRLTTGDLKLSI